MKKAKCAALVVLLAGLSWPAFADDVVSAEPVLALKEYAVLSELAAFPQRSTVMDRYAGGRLRSIWNPQISHNEKDWWMRSLKDWHSYHDGDVKGRSNSVALGIDKETGEETRSGVFGMYNYRKLDGAGHSLQQDWRVGFYTGKEHGAIRKYVYVDYGMLGTHVTGLYDTKYHGKILELGGEYQYDLSRGQVGLHVVPYVNARFSRYWQDASDGSGDFKMNSLHHTYGDGEVGVELRRNLAKATYEMRLAYKRVLTGAAPSLTGSWFGESLSFPTGMDKDYFHATLSGTWKFKGNLSASAEGGWLEGAHDRDMMADLKLNWSF